MFQLATSCGILLAQLVNYAVRNLGPYQWRVSLAIAGARCCTRAQLLSMHLVRAEARCTCSACFSI